MAYIDVRRRLLDPEDALSCESCGALLHDDEAADIDTEEP